MGQELTIDATNYCLVQLATAKTVQYKAFIKSYFGGLSKELVLLARCQYNRTGITLFFSGFKTQNNHFILMESKPRFAVPRNVSLQADFSSGPGLTIFPEYVIVKDAKGDHRVTVEVF